MRKVIRNPFFWIMMVIFLVLSFVHVSELFNLDVGTIRYFGLSRYTFERVLFLAVIIFSSYFFSRIIGLVTVAAAFAVMLINVIYLAIIQLDAIFEMSAITGVGLLLVFLFHYRRRDAAYLEAKNREIRELTEKLLSADESERQRIGQELHDSIGQSMAVLNLSMSRLRTRLPLETMPLFNNFDSQLKAIIQEIRDLSHLLNPPFLKEKGLLSALQILFERIESSTDMIVEYHFTNMKKRLPYYVETVLFRIIQEAVTNVIRHARIKHMRLELKIQLDKLILEISDKGVGFNVNAIKPDSLGFSGIRQRVQFLEGRFEVRSAPGAGTKLRITIPVPEEVSMDRIKTETS